MGLLDVLLGATEKKTLSPTSAPTAPASPSKRPFGEAGATGADSRRRVSFSLEHPAVRIPPGSLLIAPRYDGVGKPLASIPQCWCCQNPYQLERLQEWKGKTYAWLKPGCGCLNAWTCHRCFLCREHCQCQQHLQKPAQGILERPEEAERAK